MPAPTENNFYHTARFLFAGLALLALTWFTPLTMDQHGHSFLVLAENSSWSQLGDWVATWCSLKVILLGWGGFLLLISVIEFLVALNRDVLALLCGFLIILPVLTFFVGCYCLIKAIL